MAWTNKWATEAQENGETNWREDGRAYFIRTSSYFINFIRTHTEMEEELKLKEETY